MPSLARRDRRRRAIDRHDAGPPRHHQSRNRNENRQHREPDRPQPRLLLQRQQRLDQDPIGDQRRERAEIGGGVEHVGVARPHVAAGREPALQQRRARRQRGERQPDRCRQQANQPERDGIRRRRAEVLRDRDRQRRRRRGQHAEMNERADPEREPNLARALATVAPAPPRWSLVYRRARVLKSASVVVVSR